jgi:hypothetical protein
MTAMPGIYADLRRTQAHVNAKALRAAHAAPELAA